MSPSTLSRIIQRLENAVGERLFERDNRSVRLTHAGERFQHYAAETVEGWDELQAELSAGPEDLRGEISLYCSVTAAYSILPDLLGPFRQRYPGIHIRLETGDAALALDKVMAGDADFTVAALPEHLPPALDARVILHTPLVFIGPQMEPLPPFMMAAREASDDWSRIPLILSETGLARELPEQWFRSKGIRPSIYASVAGNEAILALVSLGCGIGVVPKLVLEKSMLQAEICVLNLRPPLPNFRVAVCVRRRRMSSPLVRAFWDSVDHGDVAAQG